MPEPDPVPRWGERLDVLLQDIYVLHHHRELWHGLAEITQAANLPASPVFHAWGLWYVASQGAGVRRLADRRRDSESLWRLIDEIRRTRARIDRERHLALWIAPDASGHEAEALRQMANRNYNRFAGEGAATIPKSRFTADLEELDGAVAAVSNYIDEAIAHRALEPIHAVPTYTDLDSAIEVIASLAAKYASDVTP